MSGLGIELNDNEIEPEDHQHGPRCGHLATYQDGPSKGEGFLSYIDTSITSKDDKIPQCSPHSEDDFQKVFHNGHYDYLVGDELHYIHGDHCHKHAIINNISEKDLLHAPLISRRSNTTHFDFKRDIPWYKDKDSFRFIFMFFLTGGYFFVELIWGIVIESLALQADAMHMLSDVIALIIGFSSLQIVKKEKTSHATYGWTRMEVVGGLMNGTFLLAIAFSIVVESAHRFIHPTVDKLETQSFQLIYVASVGLIVNLIGLLIIGHGHGHKEHSHGDSHGDSHRDTHRDSSEESIICCQCPHITNLNIRGVFLHILGDTFGSISVIVSGIIMTVSTSDNRFIADPICSLIIVAIIITATIPLVKSTLVVLLQQVPSSINMSSLRSALENISGIKEIHELHVWCLTPSQIIGSFHAILLDKTIFSSVCDELKLVCHSFGIHSTTIQPEFVTVYEKISSNQCQEPICNSNECVPCCSYIVPSKTQSESLELVEVKN